MISLGVALAASLAVTPYYLHRIMLGAIPVFWPELLLLIACFIFLVGLVLGRFRVDWPNKAVGWLIALFVLSTVISSVLGGSDSYGALKSWVLFPAVFFFLSFQLLGKSRQTQPILYWGLAVGLLAVVVSGFWGVAVQHHVRLTLPFNSPNAAALWLVPALFILMDSPLSPRLKRPAIIVGVITVLATRSLGGILALLLASLLAAYTYYYHMQSLRRLWFLGATTVVLLVSFVGLTGMLNQTLQKDGQASFQARYEIWTTATGIIRAHPLWGIGPNRFEELYPKAVNGYFADPIEWSVPQPHSLYLATWLSSGLFGLISLLGLASYSSYLAVRHRRYFLFAGLVAVLVHGLVDTSFWKNDLAILFFLLVALVCRYERRVAVGQLES